MSDLQSLHTQARKLILTLSSGIERLEASEQVRSTYVLLAILNETYYLDTLS